MTTGMTALHRSRIHSRSLEAWRHSHLAELPDDAREAMLADGLAATAWGLQSAINVFAPIIAVIAVLATVVASTTRTPSTTTTVIDNQPALSK